MTATGGADVDLAARVEQLTAKQRECLELVDDHATSKEIARRLGISRHTVDARLRGAIQTLGVASRREAAIIYRAAIEAESYQSFTYQPPQVAAPEVNPSLSLHGTESGQSGNPGSSEAHVAADAMGRMGARGTGASGITSGSSSGIATGGAAVASGGAASGAASGSASGAAFGLRPDAGAGFAGNFEPGFQPGNPIDTDLGDGLSASPPHQLPPHQARQFAADHVADSAAWTFGAVQQSVGDMHPRFRLWGGSNDLTPTQRVAGIFIVTVLAMLAFGTFLSGIEALTLLHS